MKKPTQHWLAQTRHQDRFRAFASLDWYEAIITFVLTFTAKTSELLLAAGLIASTANFLTDGSVMSNSTLASGWAWAQALAIDSSLGVTCYYLFLNIKHRDWIKVLCFGLLTLLLTVVAGTITNVDTFSHAVHTTIANAITQVGLNVKMLTTLRAIAVVGFLLMSRLKDVSFKELQEPSQPQQAPVPQIPAGSESQKSELTAEQIKAFIAEAMIPLMTSLAQQQQMVIIEEQETVPLPAVQAAMEASMQPPSPPASYNDAEDKDAAETQEPSGGDLSSDEREERLARAYRELQAEGERVSGRTLAARAHMRRSTCNQWLATYHPEVTASEPDEEPGPQKC